MTNLNNTVLYTGVTANLFVRIHEHKNGKYQNAFTSKYNCCKLVYFKGFTTIEEAIAEEKRIKAGSRKDKIALITEMNPSWSDLYDAVKEW